MQRRFWLIAIAITLASVTAGIVAMNEARSRRERHARAAESKARRAVVKQRFAMYDMLQPVALSNCVLERFGEAHDGGYLMCGNLFRDVQAAYSYGISGYDQWGCDVATRFNVTTHQYDCFDLTRPACPTGKTIFHPECVAAEPKTAGKRVFDTVANQLTKNGDASRRVVLKMDVEGAEWSSLRATPDEILQRIDQLAIEFHWKHDGHLNWWPADEYIPLIQRLKQFFEVAHLHFNNAACIGGLDPFPTWAYEVLFVNKRLAIVDPARKAGGVHPLDARNDPNLADCLPGR